MSHLARRLGVNKSAGTVDPTPPGRIELPPAPCPVALMTGAAPPGGGHAVSGRRRGEKKMKREAIP